MKRSIAIFLWILLGAGASGISLGFFLYQANVDRRELAEQVHQANERVEQANREKQMVAEVANQKVKEASDEVLKAHELLKQTLQEQAFLAQARRLEKPRAYELKYWKTILSLPLGVSLHIPPNSVSASSEPSIAVTLNQPLGQCSDWLYILPYTETYEKNVMLNLTSATSSVAYLVDGHVLIGVTGPIRDSTYRGFVLKAFSQGTPTHLIWAKNCVGISDQKILQTLSTLNFRS